MIRHLLILSILASVSILLACGQEQAATCTQNDECEDGFYCDDGLCREGDNSLNIGEPDECPDVDNPICGDPYISSMSELYFIRTAPGTSEWQMVVLHNTGTAPLDIEDISVEGESFRATFPAGLLDDGTYPPREDDAENFQARTLRVGDGRMLVRIWFEPTTTELSRGRLVITSNAINGEEYSIDLTGNDARGCLQASHDEGLDFGSASIEGSTVRSITLENCSLAADLNIHHIGLTDSSGGVFSIPADSYPGNLPVESYTLERLNMTDIALRYSPEAETSHTGELLIVSNDYRDNELRIPLSGQGVHSECPVARIDAQPAQGTGSGGADVITISPMDAIELTAANSSDPNGQELTYEWALISRPFRSYARFTPSPTAMSPELLVDLAGHYRVELTVKNEDGVANCEPAIVDIDAAFHEDIALQLIWHAMLLPEPEEGEGNDMSLHYVHPLGTWGSSDWSVYIDHPEQNWDGGEVRLANYDYWGEFPEIITHMGPVSGQNYDVGVHYRFEANLGPAEASLSVYLQGELVWEERDWRIFNQNDLWHAGLIAWSNEPTFHIVGHNVPGHSLSPSPPPGWD